MSASMLPSGRAPSGSSLGDSYSILSPPAIASNPQASAINPSVLMYVESFEPQSCIPLIKKLSIQSTYDCFTATTIPAINNHLISPISQKYLFFKLILIFSVKLSEKSQLFICNVFQSSIYNTQFQILIGKILFFPVCPANWNPDSPTIKPSPEESKEYFKKVNK